MTGHTSSPKIKPSYWRIRLDYLPGLMPLAVVISTFPALLGPSSLRLTIAQALIRLIAMSVTYFFWWSSATILRRIDREKITLFEIMFLGATGGLLVAITQSFLAWIFQIEAQTGFFARLISCVTVAAFWLPISSVAVGSFKRYSRLKAEVRTEFLLQESVQLVRQHAVNEYRQNIQDRIQSQLAITTSQAQTVFNSLKQDKLEALPEQLRVISNNYFRLSSHKMKEGIDKKTTRLNKSLQNFQEVRRALSESVTTKPLNPTWFSIVVLATVTVPIASKSSEVLILELLIIYFMCVFFIQKLLVLVFNKLQKNLILLTVIATVFNISLPITFSRLLPGNDPVLGNHFAFVFVILVVTCLGYIAQAGMLKEEDLRVLSLHDLEQIKIEEKLQNDILAQITKDWAKLIHGTYTTRLESAALALEKAISIDDYDSIERVIREITDTLTLDSPKSITSPRVLIDEIRERVSQWNGLIEINIVGDLKFSISVFAQIRDIGICVEEALLNAVRHGDASIINIEVLNNESLFTLLISDNGGGFSGSPSGFGSSVFEEATSGNWRLWRDERRKVTVLELNFARG